MESKVEMPAFHMESFGPLNKQFPFNKIFTALEQGVIFEVSNYLSPHLGRVFVLYTVSMSCAGDLCQRVHILIIHSVVGLQQWNQNTWQRRLISQSQLRRTLFQRQHEGSRIPLNFYHEYLSRKLALDHFWYSYPSVFIVFAGPVCWTGKKTEIELNPTAKDRTTGCGCTNSEFFRLPVATFVKKSKNRKKPV